MNRIDEVLAECESFIRSGQMAEAVALLSDLDVSLLPRRVRRPLANLARRAGLINLGLEILWPIAHPDLRSEANDDELAEYAVLLLRSGAVGEALTLLQTLDARKVPDALLFQSFCFFNIWDYPRAVERLEKYVEANIPSYARLVGRVNLASAYVTLNERELAFQLLGEIILEATANNSARLLANSHEMRAQLYCLSGDWKNARAELDLSSKHLQGSGQIDAFFIRKWRAITSSLEAGTDHELISIREEAVRAGDAESVRETDLYRLMAHYDEALHAQLLFGTPSAFYRARVERLVGRQISRREIYLGDKSTKRTFDVATGRIGSETEFNAGKKTHQLLDLLTRDFYRPLSLGALHSSLFPGEHFDPFSSPDRVHQSLRRARRWIEEANLPMQIREHQRTYSLEITGKLKIRLELDRPEITSANLKMLALQDKLNLLGDQDKFSWREAKDALALPDTSFKRFMKWALENNRVERIGAVSSGLYRLLPRAA